MAEVVLVSIYDDALNPNWSLENSDGVEFELSNQDNPHQGRHALEVQPFADFGQLYFTVQPESEASYPRDQVVGIRFWLYSGTDYIDTSDLGVSVVGSNRNPYWVADDNSVQPLIPDEPTFPETRLYYLDVNRDIPPDTWVEIEVFLNERQLDPDYDYVTGFYIKNDQGFAQTYYLDRIQLIMVTEET